MSGSSSSDMTELLVGLREGEEEVAGELFEQVHARLRELARGQRKRWKGDLSLQTTALAHEAYLELVGPEERSWESRSHFFAVAAQAMRHILIDRARRKAAEKRGGDAPLLSLDDLKGSLGREGVPSEEPADRTVTAEEAALREGAPSRGTCLRLVSGSWSAHTPGRAGRTRSGRCSGACGRSLIPRSIQKP